MLPDKLTASAAPVQPAERIVVIDTLRGLALLGMIIVHFSYNALPDNTGLNSIVTKGLEWFGHGLFYTMFALLFGVGFAIQLERAKSKGIPFVPSYLRRLLALLSFGVIAELFFGFHILLEYSLCGLVLLLVRNWSTKALVVLAVAFALLWPVYSITYNSVYAAVNGVEKTKEMNQKQSMGMRAYWVEKHKIDSLAASTPSYSTAVALRTKGMGHRYSSLRPLVFTWLGEPFLLFLIGLLAVRKGVFKDPKRHRRLIICFMIFGVVSWVLFLREEPLFSFSPQYQYPNVPYSIELLLKYASYNVFLIFRHSWLAFTYMGAVLLVAAYFKRVQGFGIFSSTGRMALTNYMVQTAIICLLFAKSGFGFGKFPAAIGPVYGLLLFGATVLFSRWWLARYHFGPLEWLWRSVTYWKVQHLRKTVDAQRVDETLQMPVPVLVEVNSPVVPVVAPERETKP